MIKKKKWKPYFYLENIYCSISVFYSVFVKILGVFNRSPTSWPHWNELCFDETVYWVCSWQITCGTWILKGKVFKNILLQAKMLYQVRPLKYYILLKAFVTYLSTFKMCVTNPVLHKQIGLAKSFGTWNS